MAGIIHKIEEKLHMGGGEKKEEHKVEEKHKIEEAKKHHQVGGGDTVADKIKGKIHGGDGGEHGEKKHGEKKEKKKKEKKHGHGKDHGHSSSSDSD